MGFESVWYMGSVNLVYSFSSMTLLNGYMVNQLSTTKIFNHVNYIEWMGWDFISHYDYFFMATIFRSFGIRYTIMVKTNDWIG